MYVYIIGLNATFSMSFNKSVTLGLVFTSFIKHNSIVCLSTGGIPCGNNLLLIGKLIFCLDSAMACNFCQVFVRCE